MSRVLATGVRVPHIEVYDDMYAARLAALDIGQVMVNFVDHVDESALVWLASQFDILGNKGYNTAVTVDEKRAVVKQAIELHRYKGTPYAIKRALATLGYTSVTIIEGVAGMNGKYDGTWQYDGSHQYGLLLLGNAWATFIVIATGITTTPEIQASALALIEENKNVRSLLVGFITDVSGLDYTLDFGL